MKRAGFGPQLGAAVRPGQTMEDDRMLVLSRKTDEVVRIGKDVEVRVLKINGGRVQIGISAPRDVAVVRGEVDERERKAG